MASKEAYNLANDVIAAKEEYEALEASAAAKGTLNSKAVQDKLNALHARAESDRARLSRMGLSDWAGALSGDEGGSNAGQASAWLGEQTVEDAVTVTRSGGETQSVAYASSSSTATGRTGGGRAGGPAAESAGFIDTAKNVGTNIMRGVDEAVAGARAGIQNTTPVVSKVLPWAVGGLLLIWGLGFKAKTTAGPVSASVG
jgi:hypothetical protein